MIIEKEWRSYIKPLIIWGICIAGLDMMMILMYPSLQKTMQDMAESYQNMGAFSAAFSMDQLNLGTPTGFYGMYIGAILSLGGAMFAATIGTSVLAKEEGGHTAEYLFTLPYSRIRIVVMKLLAILSILAVFEVVNLVLGFIGMEAIGADYSMKRIVLFHIGQTLLHVEIASIAFLVSACMKKVAMGAGLGIALLLYFMDMMSRVLDQLKNCKYITPFYYANAAEVFVKGKLDIGLVGIGIAVTVVCFGGAVLYYNRKDLAA